MATLRPTIQQPLKGVDSDIVSLEHILISWEVCCSIHTFHECDTEEEEVLAVFWENKCEGFFIIFLNKKIPSIIPYF